MFDTAAGVLELLEQPERLEAALLAAVGELDASCDWSADGAVSTHSWLVHQGRVTRPEASRLLRGGRLVQRHPRTAKRLDDGDVTCAQVDALASAARGHEELFDDHEEKLLEIAGETRPGQFRIAMHRWREIADDLAHVGPVSPSTVRRLACDAIVRRVVHDSDGEILDLGRETRIISKAQRRQSHSATAVARGRAAIDHPNGVTCTTRSTGSTADRPISAISRCTAVTTTYSSTKAGRSTSDPTEPSTSDHRERWCPVDSRRPPRTTRRAREWLARLGVAYVVLPGVTTTACNHGG